MMKLYDEIVDQREPFGVVHVNCKIIEIIRTDK